MRPYYKGRGVTLYHGDARDVLPTLKGPVGIVATDPPYSSGRTNTEFAATGNVAVCLDLASAMTETMAVFGTSSGRGVEFIRASVRRLPHCRVLTWHRTFTNSPAAGPWRWDTVLIHLFGRAAFGRPRLSSMLQTAGTQALAKETGTKAPVPVEVFDWIIGPFGGLVLDPFAGSGSSLVSAVQHGRPAIGIEIQERACEVAARRVAETPQSEPEGT